MNNKLKFFRNKYNLSQRGLANLSKVSQPHINQLENGFRTPTIPTARKLAKALDTTVDILFPDMEEKGISKAV